MKKTILIIVTFMSINGLSSQRSANGSSTRYLDVYSSNPYSGTSLFSADTAYGQLLRVRQNNNKILENAPGTGTRYQLNANVELMETGQIHISWDLIPNAISYQVWFSDLPTPPGSNNWTLLQSLATGITDYSFYPSLDRGFYYVTYDDGFLLVDGGFFYNGTSNVTLASFYMGKYEVTQSSYQAVMGSVPGDGYGVGPAFPVYFVSWFDAIEYCNLRSIQESLIPCYHYSTFGTDPVNWPSGWEINDSNHTLVGCNWSANGYRLPTEMEWMFVAIGGNQSQGYTYSGCNTIDEVAWYSSNSGNTTHTVGIKASNEIGIYDMSGNVWEWVWDIYGLYTIGDQTNPTGSLDGNNRSGRGGCWSSDLSQCAVTYRNYWMPSSSGPDLGFRVCKNVP